MSKNKLEQQIIDFFEKQFENNPSQDFVQKIRKDAFENFKLSGLPTIRNEKWQKTKLSKFSNQYFHPSIGNIYKEQTSYIDICKVPEISSKDIVLINGNFVADKELETLKNGIIVGSLKTAAIKYPELVQEYFHQLIKNSDNPIDYLNTATFSDGLFLYVPKNIKKFNLQITHKLDAKADALVNTRNLIILEENAQINMIQCDDSNIHRSHFATYNTEIFIKKNAKLNWYKYQNINNLSALLSNSYYRVEENAELYSNFIELNGKLLRNEQFANIRGENVKVNLYGLYLVDKTQQSDNIIHVSHNSKNSYSNQKFKGILDDSSHGFFNGQILVKKNAQQTNAYQKNDNILLTDKAKISSQPFLEIYADDVSCSHGSTTGQIDEDALFYIRQRGISKRDAQLLQLYAFVGEIIDTIKLQELVEPTKDLVKKRLNGELDACEECILQCATKR